MSSPFGEQFTCPSRCSARWPRKNLCRSTNSRNPHRFLAVSLPIPELYLLDEQPRSSDVPARPASTSDGTQRRSSFSSRAIRRETKETRQRIPALRSSWSQRPQRTDRLRQRHQPYVLQMQLAQMRQPSNFLRQRIDLVVRHPQLDQPARSHTASALRRTVLAEIQIPSRFRFPIAAGSPVS